MSGRKKQKQNKSKNTRRKYRYAKSRPKSIKPGGSKKKTKRSSK